MNAEKEWKWLLKECNMKRPKWSYEGKDLIKREMMMALQVLLTQYQEAKKTDKRLKRTIYQITKSHYFKICNLGAKPV